MTWAFGFTMPTVKAPVVESAREQLAPKVMITVLFSPGSEPVKVQLAPKVPV
jgi:hypothetical protein